MAHIVVYLQRTPLGLHPGSAVALCWARDIASERGASITAVATGDAKWFDKPFAQAAARFGADAIWFVGREGLPRVQERLLPAHILVPWTIEGRTAAESLSVDVVVPRWVRRRLPEFGGADAVTGVIAGVEPWHALSESVEPEFESDVESVVLPEWIAQAEGTPAYAALGPGPRLFVARGDVEPTVARKLKALGATPIEPGDLETTEGPSTVLWLDASGETLPTTCAERSVLTRIVLLPGPDAVPDPSWFMADWVLGGPWPSALDRVAETFASEASS